MAWIDEVRTVIKRAQPEPGGLVHLHTLYQFIDDLQADHPLNDNIAANIRAEVQKLRDSGEIEFIDQEGLYRTTDDLYERSRPA